MSQWTHISGAIRYDGLQRIEGMANNPESFVSNNLPHGSEGPLEYDIWVNPNPDHMAAYCVTFRGDLRDFGEDRIPELVEYFNGVSKDRLVRGGVISLGVEYGPTLIYAISELGAELVATVPYEETRKRLAERWRE